MLEIGLGGTDHLLLRAHLPYWEGVIHVVERAARLAGIDSDPILASAQLTADATLGPLITSRPGVRVPGAWGPFEVAVHAIISQDLRGPEARNGLGRLARSYGTPIAGLGYGLTHAFPSAETLANVPANEHGLPDRLGEAISALARAVVSGAVTLDGGEPLEELVGSLIAISGISAAAAHHIALRLGARDAFPAMDANVQRELRRQGASPDDLDVVSAPWRPWRALATVHLLVEGRRQATLNRSI
jgi:AraC family transcriptional regulator of adaptative response / DNA-3-methyladenine glycosylase II